MPAQLAAIIYISDYKEKASGKFFIGNTTSYARFVANSKFINGPDSSIDLIVTSGTILCIKPEDLPIHPINIVGIGLASESPTINIGIQFECIITDYFTKDRPNEIIIVLFHPHEKMPWSNSSLSSKSNTTIAAYAIHKKIQQPPPVPSSN
ncbi:hypothetical protein C1645_881295 [Glomus cerebriforme]|uniref:Uncharacterized protein n=1 Tax=Glomus cerebriforme TaxID=658196 RepID=A0A397SAW2_9GLOM|nr:hypothetical protein C1645_881295 [Glomus cerebriforme]